MRHGMTAAALSLLAMSALAPAAAGERGSAAAHRPSHGAAPRAAAKDTVRVPSLTPRGVPSLTPQGRFVHGPAYGHPPILGFHPDRRPLQPRRVYTVPVIVPGYFPLPVYVEPEPVPVYEYAPVPPRSLPAQQSAPPAPVRATGEPARTASASATRIYFCAEPRAYTDDRTSMECRSGWQLLTR